MLSDFTLFLLQTSQAVQNAENHKNWHKKHHSKNICRRMATIGAIVKNPAIAGGASLYFTLLLVLTD
jgi:hypothetical protein